ncbi:uncharacterized protein LOC129723297 [Wyeomyia smithii]|uniref:uncharacterized protein LOC129723297 n=1 Tax=Wyeomyia smithii TaxID=174621 RepID=UPI002467E0AC|nr:uncharacterized protein LOC129723297 [Wyeomyia smithii]
MMILTSLLTAILLTSLTPSAIAVIIQSSDEFLDSWFSSECRVHRGRFSELENKTTIRIEDGKPSDEDLELLPSFKTKSLLIFSGSMRQLILASSIEHLHATWSSIEQLLIEPSGINYQIEHLILYDCKLNALPTNLHRLRLLKKLELDHNHIESKAMSKFDSMKHLEIISLGGNNIKTIQTMSTINLPTLRKFMLYNNHLSEIDICWWSMSALEELSLMENKLKYVVSLSSQFPKLKSLHIGANPLNCLWRDSMLEDMRQAGITVEDMDHVSCDTNSNNIQISPDCTVKTDPSLDLKWHITELQKYFQNATSYLAAKLREQNDMIVNQGRLLLRQSEMITNLKSSADGLRKAIRQYLFRNAEMAD